MTAATGVVGAAPAIRPRAAGFLADCRSIAGRALRAIPREPEAIVPALVIPVFFFVVNIGALERVAESERVEGTVSDFRAFQLPVAIIFAVTGISRASALVTDIQNGYFDRLLMTPIRRLSLLLGLMIADLALVIALSIPVVMLGFAVGVRFETGVAGTLLFVLMAGLWGLAFTGFPYAIALKTGNPAAVNTSFILFFPFAFLTTAFLPQEALTGWLSTISDWNPVTYLLAGMRALILTGWDGAEIAKGFAAIAGVGAVSMTLAFAALRGRLKRG
ncbi:MAG: ABC transporter permease [Acidimicrobiia bacterium]